MMGVANALDTSIPLPTLAVGLDQATIDALAVSIAARVAELIPDPEPEQVWLDMGKAATYLGTTRDGLRKVTAARQIEFAQASPNGPCYFRREWLDDYRERHRKGG